MRALANRVAKRIDVYNIVTAIVFTSYMSVPAKTQTKVKGRSIFLVTRSLWLSLVWFRTWVCSLQSQWSTNLPSGPTYIKEYKKYVDLNLYVEIWLRNSALAKTLEDPLKINHMGGLYERCKGLVINGSLVNRK